MRRPAARLSLAVSAGLAIFLSACSAPAATPPSSAAGGAIPVVTSTNVYGDIVKSIGGDKVTVDAIISKTSQDPHSYEANAQDKLAVSKAKLLVENGGGYDDFLHKLADDATFDHANVITAVEVSGLAPEEEHADEASHSGEASHSEDAHSEESHDGHGHGEFNEHVWYSPAAMAKVADAVAARLGQLAPASAAEFKANAGKFKASLDGITAKLTDIKAKHANTAVAITEPVPVYLLEAAGLSNKTPEAYSEAIEEESDVPPAVLKEVKDLMASGTVKLLAYNQQTEGPQTETVKAAAMAAGVPVVDFTETVPEGKSYLDWMEGNADALAQALGK